MTAVSKYLPVVAALLVAGCAQTPPVAPSTAPVHLRVIAINDFHGNLEAGNLKLDLTDPTLPSRRLKVDLGGADANAGLIASLRAGSPYSVVVSSGDMFGASPLVSTLFRHESTIEAMNLMGVDIATPGNHEFDAGPVELKRLYGGGCAANAASSPAVSCALHPFAGAKFSVVSSNVETAPGTTMFPAYQVMQFGPVKVGFIGADTHSVPTLVTPGNIAGLRFTDEAEAINRSAAQLKRDGVNTIIVTMHEGAEIGTPQAPADWNDEACPQLRGDGYEIAKRLSPDVALILSAHTHQGYRCIVDGRPFMQAFAYGRGIAVADLTIDPVTGAVDRSKTLSRNLPVFNDRSDMGSRLTYTGGEPEPFATALREANRSRAVEAVIEPYAAAAAPAVRRPVGRIGGPFDRRGRADSSIGRMIADAMVAATQAPDKGGAQIALINESGLRADLACRGTPPCTVSYGDVFEVQPFGNTLTVLTLNGREIKDLLESQQRPGRVSALMLAPSKGLTYRWRSGAPAGQRVEDLRFDGQPIGQATDYRIVVNNFMSDGGDGLVILKTGRDRVGGASDLEALDAYLTTAPAPVSTPRVDWVD